MTETKTQGRAPALVVSHLSKRFGGAQALDDVSITILPGEVHGLLGENGSGKSTLIKTLAGYHAPDSGQLEVNGQEVKLPLRPGQFRELSMSFVHQDLGLVESLSVLENLLVSEIAGSGRHWFSWSRERRRASKIFERYGITIEPTMKVADLSPVERALLAIVRAVEEIRVEREERGGGRGLLILDEPTVYLPKTDTDELFALIRDIAATRASVLFVSHDLDEVREITDRVTVLRDGRNAGTVVTSDVTKAQLVSLIIGRELEAFEIQHDVSAKAVHVMGPAGDASEAMDIEVNDLTGGALQDVSFVLSRGEVLGVTGLAGSGFEDVAYLLFGARPSERGRLRIGTDEHDLASMSPPLALEAGLALVPANRQRDGSIGSLSVADNVTMQVLRDYFRNLKLERRRMIADARRLGSQFDVRPNDPHLTYSSLSGGNQQKVLLAKWLQTKPPLLLLHEPTQGVDVGARHQIFAMIRDVADKGQSVICASSDYEQLGMICDRVLIFSDGKIVQQLTGGNVTKERITEQAHARA